MGLVRFIGALFSRMITRSSTSNPEDPRHRLGREGERLAAKYLRKNRYRILYRNFRPKHGGEVDLVCRDRAENILAFIRYVTDRPGHDRRYAIDSSKIQSELGWKPRYRPADGIRETIAWYVENRAWWEPLKK
jgi:hypothetical protein